MEVFETATQTFVLMHISLLEVWAVWGCDRLRGGAISMTKASEDTRVSPVTEPLGYKPFSGGRFSPGQVAQW